MDTAYWASGLSAVYLSGALERTLAPPSAAPPRTRPQPMFDGPATADLPPLEPATPSVLNPFSVFRKSETMLRSQLSALSPWHLVNIIKAYDLSDQDGAALERTPARELVDVIVAAVRARAGDGD